MYAVTVSPMVLVATPAEIATVPAPSMAPAPAVIVGSSVVVMVRAPATSTVAPFVM